MKVVISHFFSARLLGDAKHWVFIVYFEGLTFDEREYYLSRFMHVNTFRGGAKVLPSLRIC